MSSTALPRLSAAAPRIEYLPLEPGRALPADVLFAVQFGCDATAVPPRCARVGLKPLAAGTYRVHWHVLSVDTHTTQGSFTFRVGGR